ncbi:hace1 [Symbiodinium sp. CCMP2592]|nr:hace1 [Symbiodinium sp. CCMP2592]
MGSAASTDAKKELEGKSVEEIAAALKELPAADLAKVKEALNAGAGPCPGPVDCSAVKVVAKDYKGLMAQPAEPKFKGALAQIFVRSQPYGGSDKSNNGHRYDSIPFANGMITSGMSCQLIHYTHEEHDKFFELCKAFNFIIVRCNPGQIKADGGDQQKFDDGMREMRKAGIQVWPSPDVMEKMGAKDALCKVATLNIGLEDTLAYYSPEDFAAGFKKTMAFQPRVIKQNRGSSGEGIWIIKLAEGNYCKEYGERSCEDGEVLKLMEANDNHEETHTVAEFIEFCVSGRSDKSGEWTSKGVGKYLEGGKEAGGQLVDQRFCPRIVEGELRYNLIVDSLVGIIHKKPKEGGISAVGGTGSIYTYYGPEEVSFKTLTDNFLQKDLPKVMPSLELAEEPVPLWWTTDFILASPEGTPKEEEKWIVGEFNCSCVGISRCLAAYCKEDTPNASFDDITEEDKAEAKKYGDLMGQKDYKGLMDQPAEPKFKGALAQIFVRSQPYGGSDKSNNGHRYDSIPFANGMITAGMSCQLIHYSHEEHDKFFELCKSFNFIIVRCNPGQIKADGGDQQKFDDGMREMRKAGIQVWPSPDVMEKMGAKDALCKVATLNIGLEDTLAYYSPEDFAAGFKKTMAFQPRVIKQNRGSSGEGIWIIKLAEGNYCKEYGERSCEDGEVLKLMEANDNHEETHTVAEFIEFCVSGRSDKSGEWTSKGVGKYLEGGKEAGGQLVDQRFCPRIVEGELRYNLIVDSLVGIIHKKPKEGGISAVGGTGSIYTYYGPEEVSFKTLTDNFLQKDLPKVMPSLELAEEPVPLWWTTDFILASPEGTPKEEEKWIVGEFNCSCVGISRCLAAYCKEDTPNASFDDITEEDKAEAKKYGDLMGQKVCVRCSLRLNTCDVLRSHLYPFPTDMGGAASSEVKNAIEGKSADEIAAALKELPADQLAKVKEAVGKGAPAAACPGPVDCSKISVVGKDYKGLLEQPAEPKFKGALAQIFVRSQPYGGSDKSNNGHRYDSIPFANGMITSGMSCQLIHYTHEEHTAFFELCKSFNFIIVRCNPGQIKADGGDQQKFDDGMREMRKAGIQVWPSPDVMEKMGAKDALCKVATLNIGLEDTLAYYSPDEFAAGFKKTMAFQPRVIKQNRGSSGEGIWIIKLAEGNYCKEYGERSCEDGEVLKLMEANDNHEETHTVAEFIEFCVSGRSDKSGEWTSKGVGKYLEGGKEAGGQLVDQRFCPRIVEGELRYNLIVDSLVGIIHKKPKEGGISAVGGTGSIYTYYGPEEVSFKTLTDNFLQKDLPKVMPSLELAEEPVPLWWTTDFILASPEGTPKEEEKWIVGEFNCSCVGISRCLAAYCKDDTPNASFDDITEEDKAEAKKYGDLMGQKALGILSK